MTKESKNKCGYCEQNLYHMDDYCLRCLNMFCREYNKCVCEVFGVKHNKK